MAVSKGVWGIDIGQCALKAIRLEMSEGKPVATAFDYVEHPKILSQPDADPDQLIREALDKFLSRNEIKHDEVAIGIAGQSGLARFVKLPPVEEKKIPEIVKFEAKQQIPFPLDEVVWDFQKIAGGEVADGFAMETEVGLFAMKRDVISRYLGYFGGSKIEVHCVQMSPLALVNFTTYETLKKGGATPLPDEPEANDDTPRGKKRCVVVLDIGTEASNLIITDAGKIIWQRPLPLGGNNFTRALTKELKLTFAKAEHLKRNAAKSPELPQILKALKPVLQDFVGEVQRSLGYFTNTHRDAHVGYMVGLGSAFRLPGLQKYLAEKLQIDVRKPATFSRITGDQVLKDPIFVENILTFPVAYGLALQGIGEARLITNLLPGEIRTDRLIRKKKPYAAAAAAALILGTAGLALGYGANYSSVSSDEITKAIDKSKSAITAFGNQETKFTAKKDEVAKNVAEVKAVIAGNDERLNWPRFHEAFGQVVPRPGMGGNLADELWTKDQGKAAVQWFEDRMRKGVRIEDATLDAASEMPQHLAMVNIEAVYPRWVDNLPAFFKNADDEVFGDVAAKRGFGEVIASYMTDAEREKNEEKGRLLPKAPDGGGWVVEVRGYTDHTDAAQFIKRSLIANLQRTDTLNDKGKDKVGKFIPGIADPVRGKVSHAFIYHVWTVTAPSQSTFVNLNKNYVDGLVAPAAAAAGQGGQPGSPPGPGGPMGGATESAAAASAPAGQPWTPLTASTAAGSTGSGIPSSGTPPASGGPMGGSSTGPKLSGSGVGGVGGGSSLGPAPGGGSSSGAGASVPGIPSVQAPPPVADDGKPRRRHEFVVMFVWREPGAEVKTPADALAGAPAASSGSNLGGSSLGPRP
ncbi:MAG: type IV pilus assembly protein PilM [Gemmataceae bacterium]